MTLQLRPYQEKAIIKTLALFHSHNALLGIAPARSGKTTIALEIASALLEPGQRMIFAAHTEELVDQPLNRIRDYYPLLEPAGAVQGRRKEFGARIICGTIQTLINHMGSIGPVDLLIIDEAHHVPASRYKDVIWKAKYYNPDIKILYITATPTRADGLGMDGLCDAVAFTIPVKQLIDDGYLVPPDPITIPLFMVDLNGLKVSEEFSVGDLGQKMNTPAANQRIYEYWNMFASDRKTLIYTATVAHAEAIVRKFYHAGVRAAVVSGHTKNPQAIRDDFEYGDLQVVANALKWTEGVDLPNVSCVIMARPLLKSTSLYIQSASRGMTANPGKADCIIMDVTPSYRRPLLNAKVITSHINDPDKAVREAYELLRSPSVKRRWVPLPGPTPQRCPISIEFERMRDEYIAQGGRPGHLDWK